MHRQDPVRAFQFNDDTVLYKQIQTIATVKRYTLVDDRDFDLATKSDSMQVQLVAKALFISRFQKSRPEYLMDFNCSTDDLLC
jgi:hypothetical protein